MSSQSDTTMPATRPLVSLYLNVAAWYLALVAGFWAVGLESIYGHPTPLYALLAPSFTLWAVPAAAAILWTLGIYIWASRGGMRNDTRLLLSLTLGLLAGIAGFSFLHAAADEGAGPALSAFWLDARWHLLPGAIFALGFALLSWAWPRLSDTPQRRETVWVLAGLIAFAVLFSLSLAMIRDGLPGITQTYERFTYEYIGDIGKTRTIREFFSRYNELHPYLTMHSKVHPPGPVVILWLMSYITGQSPLGLSIGTAAFGSLAIVPLYLWTRDLAGPRAALVTAALYALMPGVTLFTAVSADIVFMPFTVATLWLFWRAIDRGSIRYAAAAGLGYALMSLISFSLLSIGIFFALVGLWKLADPQRRANVFKTAIVMVLVLVATHAAVRGWSGYDVLENFELARAQFGEDQANLDAASPRYPAWTFRLWNPLAWFFFAGIPVSVLCAKAFFTRKTEAALPAPLITICILTLFALNLLYLGRGEGERSAMYLYPFIALPAGACLARLCVEGRSYGPFLATLLLLGLQTWMMETLLYTYW